ncbi:MAG: flagellar motor switch phosphatase FliY [Candidatus Sericytochromatia bacterium]|nr:flagellar motor switch phosphatase FliY [Candidatus Sericytochromatia bacterium]
MSEVTPPSTPEGPLTDPEKSSFSDFSNYALGAAASTMSMLLNKTVQFSVEEVSDADFAELSTTHAEPSLLVSLAFEVGEAHPTIFMMRPQDAAILCDLMMGGDGTSPVEELGEAQLSAVGEAFNQGFGNAANTLSTLMLRQVAVTPPNIAVEPLGNFSSAQNLFAGGALTLVRHQFKVEGLIDGSLYQLVPHEAARKLVELLVVAADNPDAAKAAASVDASYVEATVPRLDEAGPAPSPGAPPSQLGGDLSYGASTGGATLAGDLSLGGATGGADLAVAAGAFPQQDPVAVKQAQFAPLTRQPSGEGISGLDLILDVALKVTVELGRTRLPIRDILDLGKGSVVELDKLAGEPVDMLVNGKLIAKGEVVVIDESFGIRLTEIVSPQERFNHLKL